MSGNIIGKLIKVRGIVQGVGFRPFVYSIAQNNHITGWVRNTSGGVEIEINGSDMDTRNFITQLTHKPPPLARIDELIVEPCQPNSYKDFQIYSSQPQPGDFIPISPDVTICQDCARELFDPNNRRYRYPFINCTNCGPRFTIIQDIPYDRPKTTMSGFDLCKQCDQEYHNPLDRRFHAQPVACPECGPQVWFEAKDKIIAKKDDAIQTARDWLKNGKIIAIKGLGGFHLACDATNQAAVNQLRERKKRSDKPFALMAFSIEQIEKYCFVNDHEKSLLESIQHPIVILSKREVSNVAAGVAPKQNTLGVMLPYTPLHLLLLEPEVGFPDILVMTSGNYSDEPIAYRDEETNTILSPLADGFLLHNRPIQTRIDDSVVRSFDHQDYFIRRSRGYAPNPILLKKDVPAILATGAELKNTFCLTRKNYAFVSHHIGDLENYETLKSFEEGIQHYEKLFRISPEFIACDLHPDILSSRYAQSRSETEHIPLIQIQHHHAHLAACLADNQWDSPEPVIGVCFDGTGWGTDQTIWGGEFLVGGYKNYQRYYHLETMPLPGGDAAIQNPAKIALAYLIHLGIEWQNKLSIEDAYCPSERQLLRHQIEKKINTPGTSSMGRLFDAVSALLGICFHATYEGQAAIELELISDPSTEQYYEFEYDQGIIKLKELFENILSDINAALPVPVIAAKFHNGIAHLVLQCCIEIRNKEGYNVVALSGGVWQNLFLLTKTVNSLQSAKFNVLTHHQVAPNDGGLSLGQALIAAEHFQ